MDKEINALETNNTWTLVTLPPDKTLVDCNGSIRSSTCLMVQLRGIKPGLWPEVYPSGRS
ncbi:unnamed protein product [Rhodiola kirilowii]